MGFYGRLGGVVNFIFCGLPVWRDGVVHDFLCFYFLIEVFCLPAFLFLPFAPCSRAFKNVYSANKGRGHQSFFLHSGWGDVSVYQYVLTFCSRGSPCPFVQGVRVRSVIFFWGFVTGRVSGSTRRTTVFRVIAVGSILIVEGVNVIVKVRRGNPYRVFYLLGDVYRMVKIVISLGCQMVGTNV